MKNKNVSKLGNKYYTTLKKVIGKQDICLLDLPNYFNPGDQLIWEGEERMIKRMKRKIRYRSSYYFFDASKITENMCILLHGGGNFGDLYTQHHNFKESIIKRFPKNKIIILSSTVHFSRMSRLRASAQIFSQNPNVTIFARDLNSLAILDKYFKNSKHFLVPDAAFAVTNIKRVKRKLSGKKIFFLLRTDSEKTELEKNSLNFINNLSVSDWKIFNQHSLFGSIHWWVTNLNKFLLKVWSVHAHWNNKHDVYGLIKLASRETQIQYSVKFLSQFDLIITTRLHGHILACLLGIPNILVDNSYSKNRDFFNTWMLDNTQQSYFANSIHEVDMILRSKFPEFLKNESFSKTFSYV